MFNVFEGNIYSNPEEFLRDANYIINTTLLKLINSLPPSNHHALITAELSNDSSFTNICNVLYSLSSIGNIPESVHIIRCVQRTHAGLVKYCLKVVLFGAYKHNQHDLLIDIFESVPYASEFVTGLACIEGNIDIIKFIAKTNPVFSNAHGLTMKEYCALAYKGDPNTIREFLTKK